MKKKTISNMFLNRENEGFFELLVNIGNLLTMI